MSDADFHAGTRSQPLGDPKTGLSADLDALAAYVSSLTAHGDSPDRNADGTMTSAAKAGQAVFQTMNCAQCHAGSQFTDSALNVFHDVATLKPSSGGPVGAQLNATANTTGTFVYNPPAGTVLNAGNGQTLSVTFTPNDTTSFSPATVTVTLNVLKAQLTITAQNKSKVYGAALPALTASYSGFVNGDTSASLDTPVSLGTPATPSSPVASYTITAAGAADANYAITFVNGTLTIAPAPLTIKADDKSRPAGQPNPPLTVTYTGFVNGDTVASLDSPVKVGF